MFITAGHEHVEYLMVITCVSVAGNFILSVVIYKSISSSGSYRNGFPPGSTVEMTANWIMTTEVFIKWLNELAKYKSPKLIVASWRHYFTVQNLHRWHNWSFQIMLFSWPITLLRCKHQTDPYSITVSATGNITILVSIPWKPSKDRFCETFATVGDKYMTFSKKNN